MREIIKFIIDTNIKQGLGIVIFHGIALTTEEILYANDNYIEAYPELKNSSPTREKEE